MPELGWWTVEVPRTKPQSVLAHLAREEDGWTMLALHNLAPESCLVDVSIGEVELGSTSSTSSAKGRSAQSRRAVGRRSRSTATASVGCCCAGRGPSAEVTQVRTHRVRVGYGTSVEIIANFSAVVELARLRGPLYVRYSAGPERDAATPSHDVKADIALPGIAVASLTPEPWWTRPDKDSGRTTAVHIYRRARAGWQWR